MGSTRDVATRQSTLTCLSFVYHLQSLLEGHPNFNGGISQELYDNWQVSARAFNADTDVMSRSLFALAAGTELLRWALAGLYAAATNELDPSLGTMAPALNIRYAVPCCACATSVLLQDCKQLLMRDTR